MPIICIYATRKIKILLTMPSIHILILLLILCIIIMIIWVLRKKILGFIIRQLISSKSIKSILIADTSISFMEKSIDSFFAKQEQNVQTIKDVLINLLGYDKAKNRIYHFREYCHHRIKSGLTESNASNYIAISITDELGKKLSSTIIPLPPLVRPALIAAIDSSPVRKALTGIIDKLITERSSQTILDLVDKEFDKILDTKVCELIKSNKESIKELKEIFIAIYVVVLE